MNCRHLRLNDVIAEVFASVLKIALVATLAFSGCSMGSDSLSKPSAAQTAPATRTTPSKPSSAAGPSLGIEELIAREERGQTILYVKFVQPINQYRHFTLPQPARIVLDILDKTQGTATDETFRVDTHWVSGLRINLNDNNLRLVTEIAAATVPAYTIAPENGGLRIVIGNVDSNVTTKKHAVIVQGGRRVDVRGPASTSGTEARSSVSTPEERASIEKNYTGQKISLDFKDADIKNVFRLLAEVSGLNIIVTADVNRRVTLRLLEVPWDQAMDLIISTNGLDKEQIGNVVRISTAGTFKAERSELLAAKKAREDFEPMQTVYFNLNYATAKELESKIKSLMSRRSDAALVADERSNTIMVRDIQKSIEDVNALVSKLDLRTPQVLIESNLIETTPTFSRALGIQMETLFNNGRVRSSTRFRADPPFNEGGFTFPENATPIFTPASGFSFAYLGNSVAALLSAAEAEGNVKIISRPSVVTLNNKESQIESANIVRIRTSAATVGEAGSLREIRAGITLKVTPQVSADGFVLLTITAKSSTLDFGRTVDGIPQENTREAKANVLVRDGETVVLGGIMKDTSSNSESGVPYLKDIPALGWLFKKSSWQKDFEELVVFITPRVLAAGSENLPSAEQLWRDQLSKTQGTQAAPTLNP
jgi:type IV pilus secretin PilQ/predicted competence protein